MTDAWTIPHSGRKLNRELYRDLLHRYIGDNETIFPSPTEFGSARGSLLANHARAVVALMRVPFAPYYDTRFIMKFFKTENSSQAPFEQVELEAAGLRHAAEAFERNGICRAPSIYALWPRMNLIAMECIIGRGYRDGSPSWWPKERMVRFVRQMAAVRLAVMTQVENQLGVPRHAPDGRRVGPYTAFVWWDAERHRLWGQINRGPFPSRHEMILASLRRELLATRWKRDNNRRLHRRCQFHTYADMLQHQETIIRNIDAVPRPSQPEYFSLNHGDLSRGFNIMMRGSKVVALIDWETGSYDPVAACLADLLNESDLNPRTWREHAGYDGANFHVLPYRLEADPIQERLIDYTRAGAERKPSPDWQLIENNGGPLMEEDFRGDDWAEDISSNDDESIVDPVEMYCDSDAEAEEECFLPESVNPLPDELQRRGIEQPDLSTEWYNEPVYALMKEFIHHHRGAGVGPNGEWGRVPESYSRPLAEWEDPLFWRVTRVAFDGTRDEVINEDRALLSPPPPRKGAKAKKSLPQPPPRARRVPTLLGEWGETEEPPVSPEAPRTSWLKGRAPRRERPKTPPRPKRRVGGAPGPIPLAGLPEELEPWRVVQMNLGKPKGPSLGALRVQAVRDQVYANITQQLMAGAGRTEALHGKMRPPPRISTLTARGYPL